MVKPAQIMMEIRMSSDCPTFKLNYMLQFGQRLHSFLLEKICL